MHPQVLLIDDSRPMHALVASLLTEDLVTTHSAYDAQAGRALAASLRPDLILLDVEMPGMDGFEACRHLKADCLTANVPIIFLSSHATTEEIVLGLNLGAVDYVMKPFRPPELSSRVRAALRTSRLVRLLEEKALIDPLTGLGNRAMFDARFEAEVARRIRSGDPLSCIALDVDHFKLINDRYGHGFGDHVLSKIGQTLLELCRVEDVACRHGGEEFVVLTPQTAGKQAALLAERMRAAIAKFPFFRDGDSITVTCSFDVAEAISTYDRQMMERADQALYQSKEHGRNRVSVAQAHPTPIIHAA